MFQHQISRSKHQTSEILPKTSDLGGYYELFDIYRIFVMRYTYSLFIFGIRYSYAVFVICKQQFVIRKRYSVFVIYMRYSRFFYRILHEQGHNEYRIDTYYLPHSLRQVEFDIR